MEIGGGGIPSYSRRSGLTSNDLGRRLRPDGGAQGSNPGSTAPSEWVTCPACGLRTHLLDLAALAEPRATEVGEHRAVCCTCRHEAEPHPDGVEMVRVSPIWAHRHITLRGVVSRIGVLPVLETCGLLIGAACIGLALARWVGGAA